MRELLTRFGRHNIGFLWMAGEPMLFTLGVSLIWTLTRGFHNASPITGASFALTGYTSIQLWRNPVGRTAKAIEVNLALMYHRNVKMLDIVVARIVIEVAGILLSFFSLLFIFAGFDLCPLPVDWLLLISGLILHSTFGAGLALAISALSETTELVERLWHAVAYFLVPLSGALYMVDWLPAQVQSAAVLVPMISGTEMIRGGLFGAAVPTHYRVDVILGWSGCLIAYALFHIRRLSSRLEPE